MEWFGQFETIVYQDPALAVLLSFAGGVAAGFTPCTYPMLPIVVAFIGSRSQGKKSRGFVLSVFYVLGIALVYSALGAFAALTGSMFGALTMNTWTFLIVGNVCLFAALVMLEVFTLPTPAFLSRLKTGNGGGDIPASILMGGASALVISACTTPILGVLLAFVAAGQNVLLGFVMLFVFAYGMGILVILAGTFSGFIGSLPRSGAWLAWIQKLFGVLMLLAAEFLFIKAGMMW